jgi:hypothetical protein
METLLWVLALIVVGVGAFALGTRAGVKTAGGLCETDDFWFFGWWVTCKGGERCPNRQCKLQLRRKGSEDNWSDAGIIPGGSVRWNEEMEYRCVCG